LLAAIALSSCNRVDKVIGRDPAAALEQVSEFRSSGDLDAAVNLGKYHGEKSEPLQGELALKLAKAYALKTTSIMQTGHSIPPCESALSHRPTVCLMTVFEHKYRNAICFGDYRKLTLLGRYA
jgi:hypothetical protein